MIDFHCHVDLYPDPPAVINRAIAQGVYVLAVTTTPLAWRGTQALVAHAPRIRVALGLHPELVTERYSEVDQLCAIIPEAKYIGEIGIDGSPAHRKSLDMQQQVFGRILRACAQHGGRIMTVHSRGAASLVLDVLRAHPNSGKAVLHWFSGAHHELDRAIKQDCWFSVGPAMLRTQKGQAFVQAIPQNRILTETDGPFANGKKGPLMPWDVSEATVLLSQLWKISLPETERTLQGNLKGLLALVKEF